MFTRWHACYAPLRRRTHRRCTGGMHALVPSGVAWRGDDSIPGSHGEGWRPNDRVSDLNAFWMATDARSPDACSPPNAPANSATTTNFAPTMWARAETRIPPPGFAAISATPRTGRFCPSTICVAPEYCCNRTYRAASWAAIGRVSTRRSTARCHRRRNRDMLPLRLYQLRTLKLPGNCNRG